MSDATETTRPPSVQPTTEQPESTDPDHLAWVERQIAEAREEMKDPSKRIPGEQVWKAFGLDH